MYHWMIMMNMEPLCQANDVKVVLTLIQCSEASLG